LEQPSVTTFATRIDGVAKQADSSCPHRRARSTRERCARVPATRLETLDMRGIQAQGKIQMALASLIREGRVAEIPIPPGTRQLDKIMVRKYTASPG
jgi:hypothetical protein